MRGCACRGTAGFAHVSCLAEQAKILVAEAVENNLGAKAFDERWARWYECSLCEQRYHSVVSCALGWACWQGSKRAQRARARVFKFSSPFTRTRLLPPDTLHLPAPLPAPLPLPKTRELGNFGPSFHSMGAPPWQASVVVCLGSPWDPTGLVSGPLGLVSSRASHRPSRIACTLRRCSGSGRRSRAVR